MARQQTPEQRQRERERIERERDRQRKNNGGNGGGKDKKPTPLERPDYELPDRTPPRGPGTVPTPPPVPEPEPTPTPTPEPGGGTPLPTPGGYVGFNPAPPNYVDDPENTDAYEMWQNEFQPEAYTQYVYSNFGLDPFRNPDFDRYLSSVLNQAKTGYQIEWGNTLADWATKLNQETLGMSDSEREDHLKKREKDAPQFAEDDWFDYLNRFIGGDGQTGPYDIVGNWEGFQSSDSALSQDWYKSYLDRAYGINYYNADPEYQQYLNDQYSQLYANYNTSGAQSATRYFRDYMNQVTAQGQNMISGYGDWWANRNKDQAFYNYLQNSGVDVNNNNAEYQQYLGNLRDKTLGNFTAQNQIGSFNQFLSGNISKPQVQQGWGNWWADKNRQQAFTQRMGRPAGGTNLAFDDWLSGDRFNTLEQDYNRARNQNAELGFNDFLQQQGNNPFKEWNAMDPSKRGAKTTTPGRWSAF